MPAKKTTKSKTVPKRKKVAKDEETFTVKGDELLKKVKQVIKEGNAKEIIIMDKKGKTLIVLPLTLGVVGGAIKG